LRASSGQRERGRSLQPGWALRRTTVMNIQLGLAPIISLLAGILILVMPRLLSTIVAIYLIVIGLIGLFGAGAMRLN
jgi:Protein of unknown function (DUF3096)